MIAVQFAIYRIKNFGKMDYSKDSAVFRIEEHSTN